MKRLTVQLIIAILLTMSGIVLLFSGFWIDPALEEFTYSCIAVENALDNTPPAAAKTALNHLVTYLLEPLRKFYKSPVAILSGYRSDAVNRLAGGVVASQHRKGEAADCYVAEGPEQLLAALQNSGLPFDQAILYKRRRFLHLSLKQFGRNRMQVLVYMICVICLFHCRRSKTPPLLHSEFQINFTPLIRLSLCRSCEPCRPPLLPQRLFSDRL